MLYMSMLITGQAAAYLGKVVKTLQRWDREGLLKPEGRTATKRRAYSQAQLDAFLGRKRNVVPRRKVAYCRVSSQAQKPDLKNQRRTLEDFCVGRGLACVEFIEEIGGGLNFSRKQFLSLMDEIGRGSVQMLILAHKDRLCRFGFQWFQHFCEIHDCELLVLDQDRLSPEQEMVQDLMTIVRCFSSRLYGLRNYKKKLAEALNT